MVSLVYIVGVIVLLCQGVRNQFHLYYLDRTQNTGLYYDCLYYEAVDYLKRYVTTEPNLKKSRQIIPYCMRPFPEIERLYHQITEGNISSRFTFEELRKKEVTTGNLLLWSGSVDLIEQYDAYLHLPLNSSLRVEMFHNCSFPWFGTFCQYTFNTSLSFNRIVNRTFDVKTAFYITNMTCYIELKCDRGPAPTCLDWREICDGKIDCLGSHADEIDCFELEMNECEEDEFRCHNGQCIPQEFLSEGLPYPDCSDGTDEENRIAATRVSRVVYIKCFRDPGFWCEELDYIKRSRAFVCSDGQSTEESILYVPTAGARSGCDNLRDRLMRNSLLSYIDQPDLSYDCWFLLQCATVYYSELDCDELCDENSWRGCYINVTDRCDADSVIFPQRRILPGDLQLVYLTNKTIFFVEGKMSMFPDYICYDVRKCPFLPSSSVLNLNGTVCRSSEELGLNTSVDILNLARSCLITFETESEIERAQSSLFRCPGTSKYISKHRVLDGIYDCYQGTDEENVDACQWNHEHRFKCSSEPKCLSSILVRNAVKDCREGEDELSSFGEEIKFAHLCNGYVHMSPVFIDGMKETDETHCDHWPCNNLYTRCDGAWNCPNGADELNCVVTTCPPDTHECVSPSTKDIICLPVHRAGNGIVDCLGSTDEREHCRLMQPESSKSRYKCWNETLCVYDDATCSTDLCLFEDALNCSSAVRNVFGRLREDSKIRAPKYKHFLLERPTTVVPSLITREKFRPDLTSFISDSELFSQPSPSGRLQARTKQSLPALEVFNHERTSACNRGILIYVGLQMTVSCLCPPSYYGNRCQYQSQRISLTLQFHRICATKCFGTYGMIVRLLDEDGRIHDHEQLTYMATHGCDTKFFTYLLYRSRPKDLTKTYHVHIDAYNKVDLHYHASWILPVEFLFLPVNRIAARLIVPVHSMNSSSHCSMQCVHGQCSTYVNSQSRYFCRCHSGWSGVNCTVAHQCDCSSDSACLGIVHNQSICLCSLQRYGRRCRLQSRCQDDPCQNGATCVPGDEQDAQRNASICLCPAEFFGQFCEIAQSKLDISFRQMDIPRSLLVHFLSVRTNADPIRTTILTKIPYDRDSAIVYIALSFHLVIAQIDKDYYLAYVQSNATFSNHTRISLEPDQRCPHVQELFTNVTITSYPLLRRVKSYHLLCHHRPQLTCFHDPGQFLCLCNGERHANCFTFDFHTRYTCQGREICQNNAQCFPDRPHCPNSIFCVCTDCFYGSKCEYTTKGSGLSLDAILGYQIRPGVPINRQPMILKISMTITILMSVIGLINSVLSIMTFQRKHSSESGCRLYLLATSIVSLCTTILFAVKFLMLVLSQTSLISNWLFLRIACISVDVLLRLGPIIADWLHASVAIDRVLTVMMSTSFDKKRSRRAVRWVIGGISAMSVASILHDPIHRQVIYDEAEGRRWCFVQYSKPLQIYNSAINIIHFFIPFLINLFAAIAIIAVAARKRSIAQRQQTYRQHLSEQLHQHGHLIISCILLVVLATPRLIISFLSGCMKSARNPTLYLIGYFVSFIPPSLTFVVFIVPSKLYKKEFYTATKRFRNMLGR